MGIIRDSASNQPVDIYNPKKADTNSTSKYNHEVLASEDYAIAVIKNMFGKPGLDEAVLGRVRRDASDMLHLTPLEIVIVFEPFGAWAKVQEFLGAMVTKVWQLRDAQRLKALANESIDSQMLAGVAKTLDEQIGTLVKSKLDKQPSLIAAIESLQGRLIEGKVEDVAATLVKQRAFYDFVSEAREDGTKWCVD